MDKQYKIKLPDNLEQNFVWKFGENMQFNFNVKYNLYNRFKWWVSIKLFLPGTYYWVKNI